MGFKDKFKKVFRSKENDEGESQNSNDMIEESGPVESLNEKEEIQSEEGHVDEQTTGKPAPVKPVRNFKYLDDLIHCGASEIILDSNIILGDGEELEYPEGVNLDVDDLIIDGNNHTINANEKTRIFMCTGKNITIRNVLFANGAAENGGALHNCGDLKIINSIFSNNSAKTVYYGGGGAIINMSELYISNSSFSNNSASGYGGAVINKGYLEIFDSSFLDNGTEGYGGVIYNLECELKISQSSFSGNGAGVNGGAIDNKGGVLKIADSSFLGNVADENGGAIGGDGGMLEIVASSFSNNSSSYGGAISNGGARLSIHESRFFSNSSSYGGAIYVVNNGEVNISRCDLCDNSSQINGGAIYTHICDMNMKESRLSNNLSNYGGAIYHWEGGLMLSDSILQANGSKSKGGTIYNNGLFRSFNCSFLKNTGNDVISNEDTLEIYNSVFENNGVGKIIYNGDRDNSVLGLFDSKFRDNSVKKTIICNNGKFCTISKCIFENTLCDDKYGVIINESEMTLIRIKIRDEGKTILNNGYILLKYSYEDVMDKIECLGRLDFGGFFHEFDFTQLDGLIHDSDSNQIILEEDFSFQSYEMDFFEGGIELDEDNLIIDGNGRTIDGKGKSRIFTVTGKNIILKNIIFKNGLTYKSRINPFNINGGAIRINADCNLTIEDCTFQNCISEGNGGAISVHNGNLVIKNCIFNDGSADSGGTIYNYGGSILVENCIFNTNFANRGGAIYNGGKLSVMGSKYGENQAKYGGVIFNGGELKIGEGTFSDNSSKDYGGVIYNEGIANIERSVLSGNLSDYGGAIYNLKGDLIIDQSMLYANVAQHWGGAINNQANLSVVFSQLSENSAEVHGGAIYNVNQITVKESKLADNAAQTAGGAIYNYNGGFLRIEDSTLMNNSSNQSGGAVYNWKSRVDIENSVLSKNNAEYDGGAVYGKGGLIEILHCKLSYNKAMDDGGAILNGGGSELTVCHSDLINNVSGGNGGAIWSKAVKCHLNNCAFENNQPNDMNED